MEQVTKQSLEDINLGELTVNQAFLNITSHHSAKLWMYTLSEDCVRCPFTKFREIAALNQQLVRFDASRSLEWKFFDEDHGEYAFGDETTFCELKPTNIGPRGVYNIDVHTGHCSYDVRLDPVNYNLSVLYALLILAAVLAVVYTSSFIYRRFKRTKKSAVTAVESGFVKSEVVESGVVESGDIKSEVVESEVVESGDVKSGVLEPVIVKSEIIESEKPKPTRTRVRSLDVFRGVAIVVMIFVNSGGGSVWWMEHATWNGLYVADLVFPWFIWIMGVCIPISIKSQMSRKVTKAKILYTILIRSIKLFFIGFCLNTRGGTSFEEVRIMGVLQRFGISYFIVASIHVLVYVEPKDILPEGKLRRALYDIQILAFQWFLILCITAMHIVITFGLEVPGCPRGYLGPGGNQDNATNVNCIGGATGYVDELILGSKHIYRWPTAGTVYNASAFDPEGMVGCLTTFLQVFIGLQCGITLMVYTCWKDRVSRLLIWGIVLGVIGGGLCQFSQDDGVIPVNKNLWSLSFVFVTSALAYLLLTLFYVLVDVLKWWSGTPLVYAGMNAILLYVGHSVIGSMFPWRWSIGPMNTHLVLLVENMWHAGMWVVVSYYFYCKKVFISV